MNKKKSIVIKAAIAAVLLGSLPISISGCRVGSTEVVFSASMSKDEVFKINDQVCTLAEAKVFLTNYQNIYAKVYDVNLWDHNFGENSLETYVKDLTISQLAQIISMNYLAQQQKIVLSKEEQKQVEKAADAYYDSLNEDEISYMDVKKSTIKELYREYGLANKLYASLTEGVSDEVSDDEARVMEAIQIVVKEKAKAKEVKQKLNDGADFMTVASTYSEAEEKEITFGRGQMPEAVEKKAFAMEKDQVSGSIKTEEGYYFLKCVNNYNQELTDGNKKVILEKRRKEAFDDVYEKFIKGLTSQFNETVWNQVKVEVNDKVATKSFFDTYEEYCKW